MMLSSVIPQESTNASLPRPIVIPQESTNAILPYPFINKALVDFYEMTSRTWVDVHEMTKRCSGMTLAVS